MRCFVCDEESDRFDKKTGRDYCDECYYLINEDIHEWYDEQELELEFDLETTSKEFREYVVHEDAEEHRHRGQQHAKLVSRRKVKVTLPDVGGFDEDTSDLS